LTAKQLFEWSLGSWPRAIISFAVLCILASAIMMVTVLHFSPLCSEEMRDQEPSPDGRYVAASMVRNCGATTSYVTHFNLRTVESSFSPDFFDGVISDGEVATIGDYDGAVLFCWVSPRQINIEYPTPTSPLRTKHAWNEVTVTYGQKCP